MDIPYFGAKQPFEEYYVCFDFANFLGASETIESVTSIKAADLLSLDVDLTSTLLDAGKQSNTTTKVNAWVRAGTTGHSYLITCKVLGSAGSTFEMKAVLPVQEIPATLAASGQGLVIAPTIEPVSLVEAKQQCRIDSDITDDDNFIETLITVARLFVEDVTRRALLTQTWDVCLLEWPVDKDYIELPYGNLQSVTSVKWKNSSGVEATLVADTDYIVEKNGTMKGRIVLPYGKSWPSGTLYTSNPITIRFVCGWTNIALVPNTIKAAIKMLVAQMYEERGEAVIGQTVVENKVVDRLLASSRLW